jgi:hypothetical protein
MKWVTRARPKVDRVACPWLIKKFVDPKAQFLYVPADQVMDVAKRENAVPFDVPNVELGHRSTECSFDAVLRKYNLTDPALVKLAVIVRGADTDAKDLAPECRGLEAIADGFRLAYENDHELLERKIPVYDALYAHCQEIVRREKEAPGIIKYREVIRGDFLAVSLFSDTRAFPSTSNSQYAEGRKRRIERLLARG